MMRIALDTTPLLLGGGGVATYTRELLSAFETNAEVDVIATQHDRTGASSLLRRTTAGLAREGFYYPRGLARAAKTAGADLIHVPAAMPAYSSSIPLVLTIHDAIPWRHPEWFTRANALQQRLLVGRAARRADLVLTDSHASKVDIMELLRVPEERITVVHLGVSPAFSPTLRDTQWLSDRFGVTGPVVLSVGTPEPRKNLTGALSIFERVSRDLPEARLLLVGGGGWQSNDLDQQIAACAGRVVRAGHIDFAELTRTYASADCFLFPSLLEGFGFPPLEAMASGLPVVCSDRPSLPEVVGEVAVTAPPNDHESLAAGVLKVLTNEAVAGDMRARGLGQAATFSWEKTASETVTAYRALLDR
jgi:glycosyltransferase involved in cell wall biosynthesis